MQIKLLEEEAVDGLTIGFRRSEAYKHWQKNTEKTSEQAFPEELSMIGD